MDLVIRHSLSWTSSYNKVCPQICTACLLSLLTAETMGVSCHSWMCRVIFKDFFYFFYGYVCVPCMCLVPMDILELELLMVDGCHVWLPGIEPRLSVGAASTFKHWAISSATPNITWAFVLLEDSTLCWPACCWFYTTSLPWCSMPPITHFSPFWIHLAFYRFID